MRSASQLEERRKLKKAMYLIKRLKEEQKVEAEHHSALVHALQHDLQTSRAQFGTLLSSQLKTGQQSRQGESVAVAGNNRSTEQSCSFASLLQELTNKQKLVETQNEQLVQFSKEIQAEKHQYQELLLQNEQLKGCLLEEKEEASSARERLRTYEKNVELSFRHRVHSLTENCHQFEKTIEELQTGRTKTQKQFELELTLQKEEAEKWENLFKQLQCQRQHERNFLLDLLSTIGLKRRHNAFPKQHLGTIITIASALREIINQKTDSSNQTDNSLRLSDLGSILPEKQTNTYSSLEQILNDEALQ
eukprot:GCRY01001041.1.p1 GENE.GCRY01001041.1~~GCRY01001041.1.p1  ORF type:complete len:305 (+),score=35.98 GCRY01001041.1:222-1136(+)